MPADDATCAKVKPPAAGQFCLLGLAVAFFVSGVLLWGHYREPVGLGCGRGIKLFSCAGSMLQEYNQILGVPWAMIGAFATTVALVLAAWPGGRRWLPCWLLAGLLPLGFLRGNEITLIHGICPMCWLVLLGWVLAVWKSPGLPSGRRRAAWGAGLFAAGIAVGLAAAPLYPDLDAKTRGLLQGSGWRVIDLRNATMASTMPAGDGLLIVLEQGCPYCHAYVARTLAGWGGREGTVVIMPRKATDAPGLPGGVPKEFPTTRIIKDGEVMAEHQGFMPARELSEWVSQQSGANM